jgi:hypothetical protein
MGKQDEVNPRKKFSPQRHSRTKSLVVLPPPRVRKQAKERMVEVVLSPDSDAELAKVHSWTTNPNMSDFEVPIRQCKKLLCQILGT